MWLSGLTLIISSNPNFRWFWTNSGVSGSYPGSITEIKYFGLTLSHTLFNYEEMINFKWKRELNERVRKNNFRLPC